MWGRGGSGQGVSLLPFNPNGPSSNPTEAYNYIFKFCVWKEQKESGVGPFIIQFQPCCFQQNIRLNKYSLDILRHRFNQECSVTKCSKQKLAQIL